MNPKFCGPAALLLVMACAQPPASSFDLQGHRGCRGLMPENSLPGFQKALELGVTTLEMDAVISRDSQVLLSHEPFLSHEICLDTAGGEIAEGTEARYNLFAMDYAAIRAFDCGSKPHPRFPGQQKLHVYKPLLSEVIRNAEHHARALGRPLPFYNIETKCQPQGDGIFHPDPGRFARLLMEVVEAEGIGARAIIQSFDVRTLQYLHQAYPRQPLALLVEDTRDPEEALARLGFQPEIYSPAFELLDAETVRRLQGRGMRVIPWTVNETEDIARVLALGVDGIISDYPDRVTALRGPSK